MKILNENSVRTALYAFPNVTKYNYIAFDKVAYNAF